MLSAGFQRPACGQPLEILLLGTSNLREPWRAPASRQVRVRLLAGTDDGVIDRGALQQLADAFRTPIEGLEGVNHFGILDRHAGSPRFRSRDHATRLNARACAERVVRQVRRGP